MGLTAELGALGTGPLLSRVLGLLSGIVRTEKASA